MKTLQKIYYVPGLFSAILIPLVFWYLGNRELQKPIPNIMDLGLPSKELSSQSSFEPFRDWKYQKIVVEPNTAAQNQDYYVSEIKRLQTRNNKETGIEFVLNDQNSYGDFISILNDLAIAKHEIYAFDLEKTGHFFAITNYNDPDLEEETCDLCNDNISEIIYENKLEAIIAENKSTIWIIFLLNDINKFYSQISNLSRKTYSILFGFLIFLNISMLSIKDSFQIH